jgi:uncharacterized phage infection (PIP) family protein YhgE
MTGMAVLEDIVAQIGTKMVELAESHKETERILKEQTAETERVLKEQDARVSEKISGMSEKISGMSDKLTEKISGLADEINKWIGYSGNSIGSIVELVLVPGIKQKINEYGHNFNSLSPRKQYYRKNGKTFAEIDLFLENGDEAMVVEVKTQFSIKEVEHHLKRLELLRKNELELSLKGKTLYSAVAGLHFDGEAREMALNLGMYVVEMVEDTKNVNVIKPSVELGKW